MMTKYMVGTVLFPTKRRTNLTEKGLVLGFIIAHQASSDEFNYITKSQVSRRERTNHLRETIESDFRIFDSKNDAEQYSEQYVLKDEYYQRLPIYQVEFSDDSVVDSQDKQRLIENMRIISCDYHINSESIMLNVDARDYASRSMCCVS